MENLIELKILGYFLFSDSVDEQVEILLNVGIGDFEDQFVKECFETLSDALHKSKTKIDLVSAYEFLKDKSFFDLNKFTSVTNNLIFDPFDLRKCIELIKLRNHKKYLLKILGDLRRQLTDCKNFSDMEDAKERAIIELSKSNGMEKSHFIDPKEFIEKIDQHLSKERFRFEKSFGLIVLDTLTNGIETPRLIILGGLKKSGKSRFVINTRYNLYRQGIPSIFLSLEMPPYEVTKLTISRFTEIPEPFFRAKSFMNKEQLLKYEQIKNEIDWSLLPVEYPNGSIDIYKLLRRLRTYSKLFQGAVIFVDYLQRIKHDRGRQSFELENISNLIADATREFGITIVLLSQLSNVAENEVPTIGHLKGSGGIGESADIILLLDNVYRRCKDEQKKGLIDIYIEQRYGDSGKVTVFSDLSCCKFSDYNEISAPASFENLSP